MFTIDISDHIVYIMRPLIELSILNIVYTQQNWISYEKSRVIRGGVVAQNY